jgi:hypothetical protein
MQTLIKSLVIFFLLCSPGWGVELLVQAVDSPFEKGAKKGDIIVVRPDGWVWGKEENLPRYIIVKLPGLNIEDAKKYEEPLIHIEEKDVNGKIERIPKTVKLRKYNIAASVVDSVKFTGKSELNIKSKDVASTIAGINEKTVAVIDEK